MTWLAIKDRLIQWRGALQRRVTRRVVLLASAGFLAFGCVAVMTEALVRAHIGPDAARLPSALYTRTAAWGESGRHVTPVVLGTLNRAPMEERIPVPLSEIPARLVDAVLAVEDQRFYQHHGIDIRRIGGAMIANIKARGVVQGGSTLTQQLAKNLFLSADRTPLRKVREAAMAVMLEWRYDKPTILDAYLNEIYLGQDGARAIHGVGAASRYYLGKDVRRITVAEAAQLAAMISSPNRSVASRHADAARTRRDMVLQLMVDQRRISPDVAEDARVDDVTVGEHTAPLLDGRYFRDYVAAQMPGNVPLRGAAVYTTLDAGLQRVAEHAVENGLSRWGDQGAQAALIAIDPRNGEVLAMVGGGDYATSQFNRATDARRQPGSAFKPIVALAALQPRDGKRPAFTLASMVEDEPLRVTSGHTVWEPVDYDGEFRGNVTVRQAMEESLNVPFARIGLAVGPANVVIAARKAGITSPLDAVPSIALGSSGVSLLEMVRAYGVLATEGSLAPTRTVVGRADNTRLISASPLGASAQVFDSSLTYLVTSALQGVVTEGTGRALNQDHRFGEIAGKTGTSNNSRDAWFIAYSPDLVVGVWVGFDDGRSLQSTGAGAALPIAATFLRQATPADGWDQFQVPTGIVEANIASDGEQSDFGCGRREVFLRGTQPDEADCMPVQMPEWHDVPDITAKLGREAERFVQRLIRGKLAFLRRVRG